MDNKYTDIHINLTDPEKSIFFPGPLLTFDTEVLDYVKELIILIKEKKSIIKGNDFLINDKEGISYRAHYSPYPIDGEWVELRKNSKKILPLSSLGYSEEEINTLFLHNKLSSGLLLIMGMTGAGKSTTSAAIVVERLLAGVSQYCITAEDPPELPMNGWHGKGYCRQMSVPDGDYAALAKEMLRSYPSEAHTKSIYMIGETRDAKTASEVIRAASSGFLVITTIHSDNITNGINRLINLAALESSRNDVCDRLSSILKSTVHQKLRGKHLEFEFMVQSGGPNGKVANNIRKDKLELLGQEISRQQISMNHHKNIWEDD